MVRVVEKSLNGRKGKVAASHLETRPIVTLQGKRVKARRVDADSKSLAGDLLNAFTFAVERAIRQDRQLRGTGGPDDEQA